ncbi:MAG: PD40 domain-containing protein, partial [Patescibacteria group bacterium]|nr:PD40 domain-containing protein [Patescibacteria group bacterium]
MNSSGIESDSTTSLFVWGNLSDDARYFVFVSDATNLVANHPTRQTDIYIRDRQTSTTSLAYPGGIMPNNRSDSPRMSADGRYIVFHSFASNLVTGSTNADGIFLIDRQLGTIEQENISSTGVPATGGGGTQYPAVSDDGRYVAFFSNQPSLNPYGTSDSSEYLRDRSLGTTELISQNPTCETDFNFTGFSFISNDGRYVSVDTDFGLLPVDTNGVPDSYLRDRSIPFGK